MESSFCMASHAAFR